jgi:di/tricarboxylate transporter
VVSVQAQVVVLVAAVTILSAFVKNIGALAMMIPIAFQMARRSNASPSCFLMPMAFGSLLGGLITLVGTSPNIIVSRLRAEMTGQPFDMFDFTPVGLGLAVAGVAFLAFGYRLLPGGRRGMIPLAVLGGAMGLTAFGVLPVAIAFFAAATLMIVLGALSLREAYNAVQWPILVMLGALIPVSETIQTSGGADLIAGALSRFAQSLPSYGAVALIMIGAMAVTPFLNNAATVLVMAPIAASFAGQLGYRPDAFLMAVAVGAGCDFLTPIGHQCNTLVMGPGGYRFGDYWRLGAPLSLLVVVLGVPLIVFVWPLVR